MDTVAFFLPTRKGSQRVKNKNTRPFAGINGGLLENKLGQLMRTKKIDEILLSTNDEECIKIAEKYAEKCGRIKILMRPDALCLDTTDLQDLISYVPTITKANHILWGHVTTPMTDAHDYDDAVAIYFSKLSDGYDSLVSVNEFRNFLLNTDGKLVNNTTRFLWPRTQDLTPLYETNHAIFLAKREIYEMQRNRIGDHPVFYTMDKLSSFDIDWEDDFFIAETIFNRLKNSL
jgi:N-acylneuraminate cytidylyltransferase